jgi:TolA-binding protein
MLILLGGVVAAMRIGPVDFGLFGQKMQKFDEKEYKSHSRSGRSADETKVVTPEVYREEESLKAAAVDPLTAMQQGMDCFQKGDFKCSVSYFRQVVAGRGPAEVREEARYRMIETCAQLKRCAEVILHTSALQKEWPNSRWTGKAFLRNAECHAAQGDLDYARLVYQNVAAKFPDLADTARAGIGALGTPLQNKPDP